MANSQTLYYGGEIVTMEEGTAPQAVLVEQDRIQMVGKLAELRAHCGPDTEMVDLKGTALLPAFIDAHSHITAWAQTLGLISLEGTAGFEEIVSLIHIWPSVRYRSRPGWPGWFSL